MKSPLRELQLERVGLGLHRLDERALGRPVEAPLGQADGDGRRGGEAGDEVVDGGVEVGVGHRPVDQAPVGRLLAGQLAPEQQQLLRPGHADQSGQQPGGPAVGAEPALEERLPEAARVGGHGEVGGQGDLAAEAGGPAAHRGHHRQLDLGEQLDEAVGLQGVRRWMLPVRGRGASPEPFVGVLVDTQSAPEQKSLPVLPITIARSDSSVAASSSARTIVRTAGGGSAFLRFGRSSRMCRTASVGLDDDALVAGLAVLAHVPDTSRPTVDPRRVAWSAEVPNCSSRTQARFRK